MICEVKNAKTAAHVFGAWEETLIWSCVQGVMGNVYATALDRLDSVAAVLGDFAFFAGEPEEELLSVWSGRGFLIMVPQNDRWGALIERSFGERARAVLRYATKKEATGFDREKLQRIVSGLPDGYVLRMMDEQLYAMCRAEEWSTDLVSQFQSCSAYQKLGLGVVILKNGELVAGASSYSRYREGIEIQIDTKEAYRRKGLAQICGAKLILECLKRRLYPSWDAQNRGSLSLAEKLGYHFSHTYRAYEIRGD